MKISVASDLHIEFADIALPGGDVLILAGDIWTAAPMKYTRSDAESRSLRKRYERFAKAELAKYRHVLMVMGNHEFYGSSLDEAPELVQDFLARHAPNAELLDNRTAVIDGVPFIGTTLWAPCGSGNPVREVTIQRGMNDFRYITGYGGNLLTPAQAAGIHAKNCVWLNGEVTSYAGGRAVIITHHAPSLLCDSHGGDLSEAYCSNQHDLMERSPHIRLWAYGHTHVSKSFVVRKTKVVSNPRGYAGHEYTARHFDATAADISVSRKTKRKRDLQIPHKRPCASR